jgi:hypothetical protein
MAKQILRTVLFFLIFLLLFAFFTHLLVPKNNSPEAGIHDDWAKGFLAEPENTIDVLILGDSEVYSCVSPLVIWQEQGITSYSCGTSDQKLYQTESYLQRFFETQKPQIVLLETNILYRDYSTTSIIPHLFEEAFPLVRYHDRWKQLPGSDLTLGVDEDTMAYTYHGKKLEKANAASAYVTIPAVCTKVEMGGDNDISMVEEGIAFSPVYHIALKKTISKGGFTTWLKLQKAN